MIRRTSEELPTPDGIEVRSYKHCICDICGGDVGEFLYYLDDAVYCESCFEKSLQEIEIEADEDLDEIIVCEDCGCNCYTAYDTGEILCRDCLDNKFKLLTYAYIDSL